MDVTSIGHNKQIIIIIFKLQYQIEEIQKI